MIFFHLLFLLFPLFIDVYTVCARKTLGSRLCELRSFGLSYSRIHQIHREVGISTIQYTCKKERERVNNQTKQRSSAPHKLSDIQRDHLYDLAVHQNPHIKNRELVEKVDFILYKRSIYITTLG